MRNRGLDPSTEVLLELDGIQDQDRLIAIVGRTVSIESIDGLLAELRERGKHEVFAE